MKRTIFGILVAVVLLITVLGACAPAAAPPAPPAPAPAPPPAAPALSPEEAAWAKVVEAAKREGKLTAYSYLMVGDIGISVKRAFKERTGLDVEFITSTGAVLIERIKAERRGNFQVASTLDTASTLLLQAQMEGLTQAAGPLPEFQNKEIWKSNPFIDKEGHIQTLGIIVQGPWVNTRVVKPGEEPKSWRELLQPRWKGKISAGDPDTDPTSVRLYYQLVKKHGILDDAYFRELGKSVVLYPNVRMNAEAVARGDVDITFISSPVTMGTFIRAGAPVKAIDMEEGVVGVQTPGVSLLSGAPHPNAARVFINWWFSREGQLTYHEASGSDPMRKDVPNFLPPPARLTPKKVLWVSTEDDMENARLQRERVLKNLLLGK